MRVREFKSDFGRFLINISLTDLGEQKVFEIISDVFAYLHLIKKNGIKEWRFLENKTLSEIEFKYAEKPSPSNLANFISNGLLLDFPIKDLLYYPYKHESFNPSRLREALSHLTPRELNSHAHKP